MLNIAHAIKCKNTKFLKTVKLGSDEQINYFIVKKPGLYQAIESKIKLFIYFLLPSFFYASKEWEWDFIKLSINLKT